MWTWHCAGARLTLCVAYFSSRTRLSPNARHATHTKKANLPNILSEVRTEDCAVCWVFGLPHTPYALLLPECVFECVCFHRIRAQHAYELLLLLLDYVPLFEKRVAHCTCIPNELAKAPRCRRRSRCCCCRRRRCCACRIDTQTQRTLNIWHCKFSCWYARYSTSASYTWM